MVREKDYVVIFHSIHRVMKAEKCLKAAGCDILLIPVPRQLAADCGLAIRSSPAVWENASALLSREGLDPAEIYQKLEGVYRRI